MIIPKCEGCGACCYADVLVSPFDTQVPAELTEYRRFTTANWSNSMKKIGERCIALDPETKKCTIYANRPKICKDFGRGEEMCLYFLSIDGNQEHADKRGL